MEREEMRAKYLSAGRPVCKRTVQYPENKEVTQQEVGENEEMRCLKTCDLVHKDQDRNEHVLWSAE